MEIAKTAKRKRLKILDFIRGVTLINMLLYHAMFDIVYIFGVNAPWYRSAGAYIWQQAICRTFILLSGFCLPLSRDPVKRGMIVFFCGGAVTAATAMFMPADVIFFGVLTLIGSCMIILGALRKTILRVPAMPGFIVCAALFELCAGVPHGYVAITRLRLPEMMYSNMLTAYFGFPPEGFFSADYFPLVPWIFLFGAGYFLHAYMRDMGMLDRLLPSVCRPVEAVGKYSLVIYMLHQPVIYVLLLLWFGIVR